MKAGDFVYFRNIFNELNLLLQDAVPPEKQEAFYASVEDCLPEGKIHRIKSTSKKNEKSMLYFRWLSSYKLLRQYYDFNP